MSGSRLTDSRLGHVLLVALDAVSYALAVVLVASAIALVATIAGGGDPGVMKTLLFLCGWLLIAYATAKQWPQTPDDLNTGKTIPPNPADRSRFQRFVHALPPSRWIETELRPNERLSQSAKLFFSGVCVLATSFLMEVGGI